jgi:2,3-bisphosphoglycerate-independent phosphoglycerate mutase
MTAHTTAPVPLILVDFSGRGLEFAAAGQDADACVDVAEGGAGALTSPSAKVDGKLADIAPTLLEIIGLEIPCEMTGVSLLAK